MTPSLTAHFWEVGRCRGPRGVAARGSGWRSQVFPALAVALRHPTHGWSLYDTGYDPRYFEALQDWTHRPIHWLLPVELPPGERLERQMATAGLCPGDFRRVIVSHFHLDHVAGLHRFPRAELVYAAEAWNVVKSLAGWRAARAIYHPLTVDRTRLETRGRALRNEKTAAWEGFSRTWDFFGDGSLRLVALPGHARGQLGAVFRRAPDGEQIFLVSDACWTRANLRGQSPGALARLSMDDPAAFHDTLGKLRAFAKTYPATRLVPSHCAETLADLRADAPTTLPG